MCRYVYNWFQLQKFVNGLGALVVSSLNHTTVVLFQKVLQLECHVEINFIKYNENSFCVYRTFDLYRYFWREAVDLRSHDGSSCWIQPQFIGYMHTLTECWLWDSGFFDEVIQILVTNSKEMSRLEEPVFAELVTKFTPTFVEPEISLPWSQMPTTGLYRDEFTSHLLTLTFRVISILSFCLSLYISDPKRKNKLHGLSPRANYTDWATAACRRSDCQLLRIEGATWSAWRIPSAVFSVS
jgi:hypothetical protein